ncbi:hypothetical protein ABW21_db0205984 [Orbilia brochopaga]|nr:hypothetical protein ABW21_db0205984 [Drechslerella brochopaga]
MAWQKWEKKNMEEPYAEPVLVTKKMMSKYHIPDDDDVMSLCPVKAQEFLGHIGMESIVLKSPQKSYLSADWVPVESEGKPDSISFDFGLSKADQHLIMFWYKSRWPSAPTTDGFDDLSVLLRNTWQLRYKWEPRSPTLKFITVLRINNTRTVRTLQLARRHAGKGNDEQVTFLAPDPEPQMADTLEQSWWMSLLGTTEIAQIQVSLNVFRRTYHFISISTITVRFERFNGQTSVSLFLELTDPSSRHNSGRLSRSGSWSKVSVRLSSESPDLDLFMGEDFFDQSHGYRTFTSELWAGPVWGGKKLYGPGSSFESYTGISFQWGIGDADSQIDPMGFCQVAISRVEENIVFELLPTEDPEILGDLIYEAWQLKSGKGGLRFITFMHPSQAAVEQLERIYRSKLEKVFRENASNQGNPGSKKPYLTIWASLESWESYHDPDEISWDDKDIDTDAMSYLHATLELAAVNHMLSGDIVRYLNLGMPYIVSVDLGVQSPPEGRSYALMIRLGGPQLDEDEVEIGVDTALQLGDAGKGGSSKKSTDDELSAPISEIQRMPREFTLAVMDALTIGIDLRIKAISGQPPSAEDTEHTKQAWQEYQASFNMKIQLESSISETGPPQQQQPKIKKPKKVSNPAKYLMRDASSPDWAESDAPAPIVPAKIAGDKSNVYEIVDITHKKDNKLAASLAISTQHGHIVILEAPEPNNQQRGAAKYIDFQLSALLSHVWEEVLLLQTREEQEADLPIRFVSILTVSHWTRQFLNRLKPLDYFKLHRQTDVRMNALGVFDQTSGLAGNRHPLRKKQLTYFLLHGIPEIAAIEDMAWRDTRRNFAQRGIVDDIYIHWDPENKFDEPQILIRLRPWPPGETGSDKVAQAIGRIRTGTLAEVTARGLFLVHIVTYGTRLSLEGDLQISNLGIQDDQHLSWRADLIRGFEHGVAPTKALRAIYKLLGVRPPSFVQPVEIHGRSLNDAEGSSDTWAMQGLVDTSSDPLMLLIGEVEDASPMPNSLRGTREKMRGHGSEDTKANLDNRRQLMMAIYESVFQSSLWKDAPFTVIMIHQLSPEAYEAVHQILAKQDPPKECVDGTMGAISILLQWTGGMILS